MGNLDLCSADSRTGFCPRCQAFIDNRSACHELVASYNCIDPDTGEYLDDDDMSLDEALLGFTLD